MLQHAGCKRCGVCDGAVHVSKFWDALAPLHCLAVSVVAYVLLHTKHSLNLPGSPQFSSCEKCKVAQYCHVVCTFMAVAGAASPARALPHPTRSHAAQTPGESRSLVLLSGLISQNFLLALAWSDCCTKLYKIGHPMRVPNSSVLVVAVYHMV
jgi:hypothetical protein